MTCRHARKGIITNQTEGFDPTRTHAQTSVCDRPECILAAGRWVSGRTGEVAYFRPDADKTRGWTPVDEWVSAARADA
jgi:hypothetical protein